MGTSLQRTVQGQVNAWRRVTLVFAAALGLAAMPAAAQGIETFDPDQVFITQNETSSDNGGIDADLVGPSTSAPAPAQQTPSGPVRVENGGPAQVVTSAQPDFDEQFAGYTINGADAPVAVPVEEPTIGAVDTVPTEAQARVESDTYGEDDLIGAAEGVFGKGAQGLAGVIEDLLRKQGEPNGYIVGREAGGAFIFGARYGSGTLYHKIEGERKVYWTGPSVGFDAGANAANSFILVYNLFDTEDLFKRYPSGEGQAYFVGGLHVSYMRRGDVVLIPIRVGAGLRLGVNAGYMKFSKKQRWLPF